MLWGLSGTDISECIRKWGARLFFQINFVIGHHSACCVFAKYIMLKAYIYVTHLANHDPLAIVFNAVAN